MRKLKMSQSHLSRVEPVSFEGSEPDLRSRSSNLLTNKIIIIFLASQAVVVASLVTNIGS